VGALCSSCKYEEGQAYLRLNLLKRNEAAIARLQLCEYIDDLPESNNGLPESDNGLPESDNGLPESTAICLPESNNGLPLLWASMSFECLETKRLNRVSLKEQELLECKKVDQEIIQLLFDLDQETGAIFTAPRQSKLINFKNALKSFCGIIRDWEIKCGKTIYLITNQFLYHIVSTSRTDMFYYIIGITKTYKLSIVNAMKQFALVMLPPSVNIGKLVHAKVLFYHNVSTTGAAIDTTIYNADFAEIIYYSSSIKIIVGGVTVICKDVVDVVDELSIDLKGQTLLYDPDSNKYFCPIFVDDKLITFKEYVKYIQYNSNKKNENFAINVYVYNENGWILHHAIEMP